MRLAKKLFFTGASAGILAVIGLGAGMYMMFSRTVSIPESDSGAPPQPAMLSQSLASSTENEQNTPFPPIYSTTTPVASEDSAPDLRVFDELQKEFDSFSDEWNN